MISIIINFNGSICYYIVVFDSYVVVSWYGFFLNRWVLIIFNTVLPYSVSYIKLRYVTNDTNNSCVNIEKL